MSGESCFRCKEDSVYYQSYSGKHLCINHLIQDIVIRAKRTIRRQGGLGKKPVIVVIHDGPGIFVLLAILGSIVLSRPGMKIVVLTHKIQNFTDSNVFSFLPSSIPIQIELALPDSFQETVVRTGADRIIQSTFLEEEAGMVLDSLLSGDFSFFMKKEDLTSMTCLTPLCEIPGEELAIFSQYSRLPDEGIVFFDSGSSRKLLTVLSENHPSVPFSLIKYRNRLLNL